MPAWLGWVAVVLLSLYLAVYPMLAVGLAWRYGRERRLALVLALAGAWAICEWLRAHHVHRLRLEPGRGRAGRHAVARDLGDIGTYGLSLLVVLAGGMLWLLSARVARAVGFAAIAALLPLLPDPRVFDGIAVGLAVRRRCTAGSSLPANAARASAAIRIVQPNIGQAGQVARGLRRRSPARASRACRGARSIATRPAGVHLLARSRGDRAAQRRARRAPRRSSMPSARARSANACPGDDAADRRPGDHLARRRDRRRRDQQRVHRSIRGAADSGATTRRTSCPMANICRCGRSCRRSACRGWRRATSTSPTAGPALDRASRRRAGRPPDLLRNHLLGRSGRPRATARDFLFNPSNDAWFGALGPAAAPGPGAAPRGRGRHAGHPLDPDRDQRGDRCARPPAPGAPVARAPGSSMPTCRPPLPRRRRSRGSAMSSRWRSASCSCSRAIALARRRRYRQT